MASASVDVQKNQPSPSPQEIQRQSLQRCIQTLLHASQCRDAACGLIRCNKMKRVVQHFKGCKKKVNGSCRACKQLIFVCSYHAKRCRQQKCPMPFCLNIKVKLRQLEKMKDLIQHSKGCTCKKKFYGGCPMCTQLIALCLDHAKHCRQYKCPVPYCPHNAHMKGKLRERRRIQQELLLLRNMENKAAGA